MKKSAKYFFAAIVCFLLCPVLGQIDASWGIVVTCIGLLILAYALATGQLKLFG